MKMTPTAAVGLLLGLSLLLLLVIEVEALMCTQQWRHKSANFGHTKKAQDMEQEPIQQFGSYRMLPIYRVFHDFRS
jgi:hypothetical protein